MTASITRIADHVDRGVSRLIERYRKPKISALLASWLTEIQELEDTFYALLTTGLWANLDVLGRIVGQPREGRADAEYIQWIRARIIVNRSSGTPPELIRIVKLLGGTSLVYREEYPAAVVIRATFADVRVGAQVAKLLAEASLGGVRAMLVWSGANPFRFAPGNAVVANTTYGFNQGKLAAASDGTNEVTFA